MSTETFPRRACIDKFVPAERAIYDALGVVEQMPADARLTDAVALLQQARDKVADFVDGVPRPEQAPELKVTCYWDPENPESGYSDICDIVENYSWGEVVTVQHVAIVNTTFHARLPAADDATSDDDWEIEAESAEDADAAVTAELARRKALTEAAQ